MFTAVPGALRGIVNAHLQGIAQVDEYPSDLLRPTGGTSLAHDPNRAAPTAALERKASPMTRTLASLLVLTACALLAPASKAAAQCTPGAILCAEAHIGFGASLTIGTPPPAQVVVVQPAPPPPPPQVVYVQPAPPPPTATVYVSRPQVYTESYVAMPMANSGLGLHGSIGGTVMNDVSMGGFAGALRIRPNMGNIAVDLGLGIYGGSDYNDNSRVEVPFTGDLIVFFNPLDQWQFYGLVGLGVSFAHATPSDEYDRELGRDYGYVGGQLGVGVELALTREFALNLDVRGFIRERVDGQGGPEFRDEDGRTTDTSGGATANLGATIYF